MNSTTGELAIKTDWSTEWTLNIYVKCDQAVTLWTGSTNYFLVQVKCGLTPNFKDNQWMQYYKD